MGKANANREATIAEAQAAQEAEKANASAEANVAQFHRDRDIIKQQSETQVELERANKEIAFQLQTAKRQQDLIVEQRKIDIRAKEQEVLVQQQEVKRGEQEQEAAKVVPARMSADAVAATADGEKRKLILTAEGEKERAILVAEGERERLSRTAAGEAERIRQEGTAEADIIRLKGEAQAYAIKATGLAEAEAMRAKAEAWEQYGRAAVTQLIVEKLPEIVANAAKSLETTQKLIIMGERGPSQLVGSVVDIAATAPALVKALTGMDLSELAGKLKDISKRGSGEPGRRMVPRQGPVSDRRDLVDGRPHGRGHRGAPRGSWEAPFRLEGARLIGGGLSRNGGRRLEVHHDDVFHGSHSLEREDDPSLSVRLQTLRRRILRRSDEDVG